MINAIIFSKDKAAQLRLLIYSIQKNAPHTFNLNVIYNSSSEEFKKGYEKVKGEFSSVCNFVEQSDDFKKDVSDLLSYNSEFSCFFTDDDVVYRPINSDKIKSAIREDEDVFCFSLRLGKNTTHCYILDTPNVFRDYEEKEGVVKWDWSLHYIDFGYPLSVNGHIFNTKDIFKLTKKSSFKDMEGFEESLQMFDYFPKNKMIAFSNSALVSVVNNNISEPILNKDYLEGKIIDIETLDFSNVNGCHQKIEFKYK